jgi:3-hydroxyisobutyrate dehydrogenase
MKSVGLVGIGQMGMPMGRNLLKAGFALKVYARNKSSLSPLVELDAESVETPRRLFAESDLVFLCLPTPKDVTEIIFGGQGLVSNLDVRGKTIIDTSTIDPKSSRNISKRLLSLGVEYLDAPVSGGPEGAANATLTFMVGGKKEVFDRFSEYFAALGRNIFYMGPSGSGTGTKLVNQLLVSSNTLAAAEAMQLALALGLDSGQITEVIKTSAGDSFAFRRVAPKIASSIFGDGWQTYLLEKDLKLLLETESDLKLPGVSVKSSFEIFSESVREGNGKVDSSSVIKVLEKMKSDESRSTGS